MATTNGRWSANLKVSNPALEALGTFKTETVPVKFAGKNQSKVQQILDRVGYK